MKMHSIIKYNVAGTYYLQIFFAEFLLSNLIKIIANLRNLGTFLIQN